MFKIKNNIQLVTHAVPFTGYQFPVYIRFFFTYFSIFQKARIKLTNLTYIWPSLNEELGLAVHIDLVHLPVLHPVPQAHPGSAEAT